MFKNSWTFFKKKNVSIKNDLMKLLTKEHTLIETALVEKKFRVSTGKILIRVSK